MKLKNYSVQNGEKDDKVLHSKSCNVNMRLLKHSSYYREVINAILGTMKEIFYLKCNDYGAIQGISGPNLGIPLRIIMLRMRREKDGKHINGLPDKLALDSELPALLCMLNPRITSKSSEKYTAKSNCGALLFKTPINIERFEWVQVSFFDVGGRLCKYRFHKPIAATIQHEIDHLNGILITER